MTLPPTTIEEHFTPLSFSGKRIARPKSNSVK